MLASMVVSNAIADAEPDVTDMVVTVTSKVGREGPRAAGAARPDLLARGRVGPRAVDVARAARDGRAAVQPVRAGRPRPHRRRRARRVPARRRRDRRRVAARPGGARGRHRAAAGDAAPVRRPRVRRDRAGRHPAHRGRRGDQDRGRVGRAWSARTCPQAESLRGYIDNMRKYYGASIDRRRRCRPRTRARRCAAGSSRGCRRRRWTRCGPSKQTKRADSYTIADRTVFPAGSSSAASRSCRSSSSQTFSESSVQGVRRLPASGEGESGLVPSRCGEG